jgi:hypothetical protein
MHQACEHYYVGGVSRSMCTLHAYLALRQRLDEVLDDHSRALDLDDPHHNNEPSATLKNCL